MPNWKKVIISGSNAKLNSLVLDDELVANSITANMLYGTASMAISASWAPGGGGGGGNGMYGGDGTIPNYTTASVTDLVAWQTTGSFSGPDNGISNHDAHNLFSMRVSGSGEHGWVFGARQHPISVIPGFYTKCARLYKYNKIQVTSQYIPTRILLTHHKIEANGETRATYMLKLPKASMGTREIKIWNNPADGEILHVITDNYLTNNYIVKADNTTTYTASLLSGNRVTFQSDGVDRWIMNF